MPYVVHLDHRISNPGCHAQDFCASGNADLPLLDHTTDISKPSLVSELFWSPDCSGLPVHILEMILVTAAKNTVCQVEHPGCHKQPTLGHYRTLYHEMDCL